MLYIYYLGNNFLYVYVMFKGVKFSWRVLILREEFDVIGGYSEV